MLARSLAQHTGLACAVTDKLAETKKSDQAKKELHKLELQAQKAKKQEVRLVALKAGRPGVGGGGGPSARLHWLRGCLRAARHTV